MKSGNNVPDEIRILTFCIADTCFGADMEEIGGMLPGDRAADREYEIFFFHEKISFAGKHITYRAPMILLLNDSERRRGICVDQPADMNIVIPIDSIRPLPPLITSLSSSFPLWGVTEVNKQTVLLIDIFKLMDYGR